MITGAAYIRVSTDDQVELSPDSQLKMIEKYAKDNDIILSQKYIYADEGISGRTAAKRPAFMEMISTAKTKPKPFDVILVWKLSRFARNREDSIVYKSMLKKDCGIEVVSVSEPLGNDKTSILIEALLEAMDEYYSVNLAEEVRRGMTEKISRGGIVVAPPIGYKIEGDKYVPDDNAVIVKRIFEDFVNGHPLRKISEELNNIGHRTLHGNKFDVRQISYILSNPTYIGKLRWSSTGKASKSHSYVPNDSTVIVDGKHEPIIDKATFDAAQQLLAQNKAKYPKHYNQRSTDYFFRGIVRCSNCGATLTRVFWGKDRTESLQCNAYACGKCNVSHSIMTAKLRDAVVDQMQQDFDDPNFMPVLDMTAKQGPNLSRAKAIEDQLKREQAKLDRVKAAYEDGIDTLDEYKANKIKITAEIESLQAKLQSEADKVDNSSDVDYAAFKDKLASVIDVISTADVTPQAFNDAILEIVSKIVFNRPKAQVKIFYKG